MENIVKMFNDQIAIVDAEIKELETALKAKKALKKKLAKSAKDFGTEAAEEIAPAAAEVAAK